MRNDSNNRIVILDSIRAICILWIVGVWHFSNYSDIVATIIKHEIFSQITFGVLAVFTLISGLLTGKHELSTFKDVLYYLKHRFIKLYPLYFLSCLGFKILDYYSTKQFVKAACLIGILSDKGQVTLWFLNMIIVFDIIAIPLLYINHFLGKTVYILASWGVIAIMVYGKVADDRLLLYWPIFSVAIVTKMFIAILREENVNIYYCMFVVFITAIIIVAFIYIGNIGAQFSIITYYIAFDIFMLIWASSVLVTRFTIAKNIVMVISGASYCMYLFHRHFYSFIIHYLGNISVIIGYIVVLPTLIIMSYYVQKIYNSAVAMLRREKN